MKNILSIFKRTPKLVSLAVAVILTAIIVPAALFAWGPDRPTYTSAVPADHVTFNSITDNPVQGDERNFVQVREINAGNETYADSISLSAGHKYVVYVYYHNNAASNLNASGVGIAHNVYVKAQIPAVVTNGSTDTKGVGYISASDSNPTSVWDNISFSNNTGSDISLRYVTGSATIHNLGSTNGQTLSDNIVTTGAALGYNALDGVILGCNEYAGYVTFEVKADQPNFTVEKQVRIAGTTTWQKSITANAGDNIEYLVQYINTGTTDQNDVIVDDTLPAHVSYVNGTSVLKNTNNPTGKTISDNVTKGGINIGSYSSNANAYVKFSAKIDNESALVCGLNTLTNSAKVMTNNGSKQDTATVLVNKTCTNPPVTPPELPHTGPMEDMLSILGLGAMVASIGYYLASRRKSLNQ